MSHREGVIFCLCCTHYVVVLLAANNCTFCTFLDLNIKYTFWQVVRPVLEHNWEHRTDVAAEVTNVATASDSQIASHGHL